MGSVLIVGCGIFGLSTALELVRKGYDVTAIDAYEPPSPWSAACDYNKIIRAEYTDDMYTKMAVEAILMWRSDPLYRPSYNECGRVMATPDNHPGRRAFEMKGYANVKKFGLGDRIQSYTGGEELAKQFKFLKYNSIPPTSEVHFNPDCGLGHAANSMVAVYREAKRLGVKFIFGPSGKASGVKKNGCKASVVAEDGTVYTADQILLASGANTASIVGLNDQQSATGLFVSFIKLTPEEYEDYKDMAILFDANMGYFFPPDPETHLLKVALPGAGSCHIVKDPHDPCKKLSLPRYWNQYPTDTIPTWGRRAVKCALGRYVPDLAYHKLVNSHVCWVADTADSNFLIDKVPETCNLYVATGDSGHGYKFLPNLGRYIVARLEGTLDAEKAEAWKWKDTKDHFDPDDCDWRVGQDFQDLSEVDFVVEPVKSQL